VGIQELRAVARRAPGSIDMRAAMAAIYWAAGEEEKAEEVWNWACSRINSGQLLPGGPVLDSCEKYADADWLGRIRRWPPVMVRTSSTASTFSIPSIASHLSEQYLDLQTTSTSLFEIAKS
jgi:hypothetical protein